MTRTTMPQLRGREIATGKLAQLTVDTKWI